jgi:hypothetical protein
MRLANGYAVEDMQGVEKYIHDVWRSVSREFPPEFKYEGWRRCTHQEEYREAVRKRTTRPMYDIARSDFFMVRYDFSFEGKLMKPKFIYLPSITENCTIHISNGRYLVSPVLADRVISIGMDYVFVRLLRDKMTFEKLQHHIKVGGVRETVNVLWSQVYHKNATQKKIKNPLNLKCVIAHYLFCKYGFTETLQRFGKTNPVVGDNTNIDTNLYPEDKWVILSSNQTQPRNYGFGPWAPSQLKIAIRREEFTPMVKNLIGGLFYVVDHFPEQFHEPSNVESPQLWLFLMGQINFSPLVSRGKLINDMTNHIASLDDYIDSIMIDKFKEIDRPITDLYQLFAMLIENFDPWLRENADKVNSMYDKELNVIGFLLETLTFLIVKMNFRLKAAAKKGLKQRDVESALQSVKTGALFGLVKTSGCLSTTTSPGDNKAFKLTTILIPQTASQKGVGGKDRGAADDPTKRLHISVAENGGYSMIPKAAPDGRGRLNGHSRVSPSGQLLRHEDLRPMLDGVETQIKRL